VSSQVEPSRLDRYRTIAVQLFAEQFNGLAPHIDDDFFLFGLDSIVAISLVHKARRRGLSLSHEWCSPHRQSANSRPRSTRPSTRIPTSPAPNTVKCCRCRWCPGCTNTAAIGLHHTVLLRLPSDIDRPSIELMLQLLLDGHDTLRSILIDTPAGPRLVTASPASSMPATCLPGLNYRRRPIPNCLGHHPFRADRDG